MQTHGLLMSRSSLCETWYFSGVSAHAHLVLFRTIMRRKIAHNLKFVTWRALHLIVVLNTRLRLSTSVLMPRAYRAKIASEFLITRSCRATSSTLRFARLVVLSRRSCNARCSDLRIRLHNRSNISSMIRTSFASKP